MLGKIHPRSWRRALTGSSTSAVRLHDPGTNAVLLLPCGSSACRERKRPARNHPGHNTPGDGGAADSSHSGG